MAEEDDGSEIAEGEAAEGAEAAEGVASDDSGAVYEVPVEISAVLGTAQIPVSQLLKMGRGAVLELDRLVGDPIDIYVNEQMVAKGEVMVVEDRLAITLTDTLKRSEN
jgi:flagellar motor switch protein FliN/FliY